MAMADDRKHSSNLAVPAAAAAAVAATAVGIDRDKNSQQAVKWATDHLLLNTQNLVLIHVRHKTHNNSIGFSISEANNDANRDHIEAEMEELFLPYRGFCARRRVNMKEVILEDTDVAKAISDYISVNNILNIVVGASNKNTLAKRLWQPDMPANLMKIAPEFCAVYVICKGKAVHARPARGPLPSNATAPPKQLSAGSGQLPDPDDAVKTPFSRGRKVPAAAAAAAAAHLHDQRSLERSTGHTKHASHHPGPKLTQNNTPLHDAADLAHRLRRFSGGSRDFEDNTDSLHGKLAFYSNDSGDSTDYQNTSGDGYGASPDHNSRRDLEAEMRRLKLELKQTMDMYSNACKEAINAKQKAKELVELKMEEAQRFEEARNAEKAAIAVAEMEKAKCKAALEAAEASQRIAELEAQKRRQAELKAKREGEEKMRAMDALVNNDVRYRKYSIEEIELATENFSESLKVGEGGYGPVFRACLDHTPVAIKVLRPDAAQGRKQFNQEVEVLSCIRHPNMVLLLGACPEYGCLVYEYMDNGSLEDRLFRRGNTRPIPWAVRFKIAAEIATALLFLHQAKPEPLVHRDLKPANILLDRNYVSKISDVGLARLVPASVANSVTQYRMTSTAGTFCYIDPEYQQTGMLGCKSDIYSLGVMLLQMITARPAMALSHHVERAIERGTFAEVLDPTLKDWPLDDCLSFAKLALKCAELRKKDRPDLATVILPELNRLRNLGNHYRSARR